MATSNLPLKILFLLFGSFIFVFVLSFTTCPNITVKDVLANPDKPWNYSRLSQNPNITMEIVLAHPEIPWDYKELSLNTSITLEDVLANPQKPWAYDHLSQNTFSIPKNKGIVAMEKESKARVIARTHLFKEELMEVCWNPARIHSWWSAEGMDDEIN
jgi:hypothetical protein